MPRSSNKPDADGRWTFPLDVPAGVSVYKPKGSTARVKWHVAYRPARGAARVVERVSTDAKLTLRRATELSQLVQLGQVDPKAAKLDAAERKGLPQHVADYREVLRAKNVVDEHADLVRDRILRVVAAARWSRISDISPSQAMTVIAGLTDARVAGRPTEGLGQCPCGIRHNRAKSGLCGRCVGRKREGRPHGAALASDAQRPISLRSRNHYLRALKQFTAWMAGPERRAKEDVLKHLEAWNPKTDERHLRQDLGDARAAALVEAARTGPVVCQMAGSDRAMLIETAVETGLRAKELATLVNSPAIFKLAGETPHIVVRAAYSKHRREDHQPVRRAFAVKLAAYLAGRPAGTQVWAVPDQPVDLIRGDLLRAGIALIDEHGRHADFHALRHTYVCRLVRSGVNPKECQALARHASITTTMDYYAHLQVQDISRALDKVSGLALESAAQNERVGVTSGSTGFEKPTVTTNGKEAK